MFFVLFKGAKASLKWPSDKAAWVAAIIGGCVFVLAVVPGIWLLKWTVKRDLENHARKAAEAEAAKDKEPEDEEAANPEPSSKAMKVWNSLKKAATHGLEVNIHEVSARCCVCLRSGERTYVPGRTNGLGRHPVPYRSATRFPTCCSCAYYAASIGSWGCGQRSCQLASVAAEGYCKPYVYP